MGWRNGGTGIGPKVSVEGFCGNSLVSRRSGRGVRVDNREDGNQKSVVLGPS